jgi:hypothetical protein
MVGLDPTRSSEKIIIRAEVSNSSSNSVKKENPSTGDNIAKQQFFSEFNIA